jgi:exosortase
VALIALGCLLRVVGSYYYYYWPDRVSLLPVLAGLVLLFGGGAAIRWSWPALLFLVFMFPLPSRMTTLLAQPLQRVGTVASTYVLETLGFPAVAEGNVIVLSEVDLGIVEACSGLRMLLAFFAAASAVALLSRRPLWIRLSLIVSAPLIAVLANILRITVTAVLYETTNRRTAEFVFHDLAGWLMIPIALVLLWLEILLLSRLVVVLPAHEAEDQPVLAPGRLLGKNGSKTGNSSAALLSRTSGAPR